MPRADYTVKNYDYAVGYRTTGPAAHGFPHYRGVLNIVGQPESRLIIYGIHPGAPIVWPTCNAAATSGTIAVPMSELHYYLDILRNEGPVYMALISDNPLRNTLYTGQEPAGDQEGP